MKIRLSLIIILSLLISSCGGSKKISQSTGQQAETNKTGSSTNETSIREEASNEVSTVPKDDVGRYIEQFADIAQEEMRQYGIPASITLAQGVLESGAGKGELVNKANNHFGIKCHDWKGATVFHDDDEQGECFRKYSLAKFSYRDHSLFLTNRGRYAGLFKLPKDDYKGWAKGLRAAGYATDTKYPDKLIRIVERYKLYRYDGEVLGKKEKDFKKVVDRQNQHTVEKGETLYRLSKKYKISVEELKEINSLEGNEIFEGQILFIKAFEGRY